jgi:hypothetical protein
MSRRSIMATYSRDIPETPDVRSNGSCYCGCGGTTKPGKYFVITHDRKAETRVIRERFGNIATLVVWAETHMPKIEDLASSPNIHIIESMRRSIQ